MPKSGLKIPLTPLELRYRRLEGQVKQLEVAAGLRDNPDLLVDEFLESISALENYQPVDAAFYPAERVQHGSEASIRRTIDLAMTLKASGSCTLSTPPSPDALTLTYVDRELRPLRARNAEYAAPFKEGDRAARGRSTPLLDLVLSHQRTPVVVEVKLGSDQNSFYALIQVLMHAAALSSPHQRKRLAAHADVQLAKKASLATEGPLDVLIVSAREPASEVRRQLGCEARSIANALIGGGRLSKYIGSIRKATFQPATPTAWTTEWHAGAVDGDASSPPAGSADSTPPAAPA